MKRDAENKFLSIKRQHLSQIMDRTQTLKLLIKLPWNVSRFFLYIAAPLVSSARSFYATSDEKPFY